MGIWGILQKNVEQAYQHAVNNGALAVATPAKKLWGQEVAYVRDCNGIIIEICSPIN